MNYNTPANSIITNTPFNNPYTKVACGIGVLYLGFMGVRYAKKDDPSPSNRRARKGFTTGKINHSIDHRNKAFGRPVKNNPKIPYMSRHNYNRRRRSKAFW